MVSRSVKMRGPTPDGPTLLIPLIEALASQIESDPELQAACDALQRHGFSPLVRVELVPVGEGPRVVAADRREGVPQWSQKDADFLRSVGIASEGTDANPTPSQPRRRQPR
jgi:hypothetical protein